MVPRNCCVLRDLHHGAEGSRPGRLRHRRLGQGRAVELQRRHIGVDHRGHVGRCGEAVQRLQLGARRRRGGDSGIGRSPHPGHVSRRDHRSRCGRRALGGVRRGARRLPERGHSDADGDSDHEEGRQHDRHRQGTASLSLRAPARPAGRIGSAGQGRHAGVFPPGAGPRYRCLPPIRDLRWLDFSRRLGGPDRFGRRLGEASGYPCRRGTPGLRHRSVRQGISAGVAPPLLIEVGRWLLDGVARCRPLQRGIRPRWPSSLAAVGSGRSRRSARLRCRR